MTEEVVTPKKAVLHRHDGKQPPQNGDAFPDEWKTPQGMIAAIRSFQSKGEPIPNELAKALAMKVKDVKGKGKGKVKGKGKDVVPKSNAEPVAGSGWIDPKQIPKKSHEVITLEDSFDDTLVDPVNEDEPKNEKSEKNDKSEPAGPTDLGGKSKKEKKDKRQREADDDEPEYSDEKPKKEKKEKKDKRQREHDAEEPEDLSEKAKKDKKNKKDKKDKEEKEHKDKKDKKEKKHKHDECGGHHANGDEESKKKKPKCPEVAEAEAETNANQDGNGNAGGLRKRKAEAEMPLEEDELDDVLIDGEMLDVEELEPEERRKLKSQSAKAGVVMNMDKWRQMCIEECDAVVWTPRLLAFTPQTGGHPPSYIQTTLDEWIGLEQAEGDGEEAQTKSKQDEAAVKGRSG